MANLDLGLDLSQFVVENDAVVANTETEPTEIVTTGITDGIPHLLYVTDAQSDADDDSEYSEFMVVNPVEPATFLTPPPNDKLADDTAAIANDDIMQTMAEIDALLVSDDPNATTATTTDQGVVNATIVEPPAPLTIGIGMTLTNERHIIERALMSVLALGDKFLFTYNGDDKTDEVVKEYLAKHNCQCEIEFYPWKNYGHNKSKLLKDAHEGFLKDCTFVQWLDADEVFFDVETNLYPDANTKKRLLNELEITMKNNEHFDVQMWTFYAGMRYPRWNILRNNQLYKWHLPVHEVLLPVEFPENSPSLYLTNVLNLCARKDGARSIVREGGEYSKAAEYVKYYEDWFEEDEENKNDPRAKFYYAKSCQEAYGDTRDPVYVSKFLDWYQRRIDDSTGAQQERYLSMYNLGKYLLEQHKISAHKKSYKKAIRLFERATREFPERFEAIHALQYEWWEDEKTREKLVPLIERRMNTYIVHSQNFDFLIRDSLLADEDITKCMFPFQAALLMHRIDRHDKAIEYNQYALRFMSESHSHRSTALSNDVFFKKALRLQIDAENGIDAVIALTEDDGENHLSLRDSTDAAEILANLNSFLPLEYQQQQQKTNDDDTTTDGKQQQSVKQLAPRSIPKSHKARVLNDPSCFILTHPPDIVVIDNFLRDPLSVRKFGLAQSFNVTGNYPGSRTIAFANPTMRALFEQITCSNITYWPDALDSFNGAFQLTDVTMKSWIHHDKTTYAGILYLTPDGPLNAGTSFYRHIGTGLEYEGDEAQNKAMGADSQNLKAWEVTDVVSYKFNRLVLFNGKRAHMSGQYFGRGKETGRLFMNFFFDATRR